jgi:hypothetical protein
MTSTGVREWAQRQARAYSNGDDRPPGGYLRVLAAYAGGVTAASGLARVARRRVPDTVGPWDLALLSVATHRLSRTLAKDPVTSPLRAPFTRYEGVSAAAELDEQVRTEHGVQHSIGELISCPMCLAQWVASAFGVGLVLAPRQTRLAMAVLSAVAGADFLQYVYSVLQQQAGE